MKTIDLSPEQKATYNSLLEMLETIDKEMRMEIDVTNGDEIAHHLMQRINLLSLSARIMELATLIYDWAKGTAAEEILLNENLLDAKQDIQRKIIEGKIAKWDALYTRADRTVKDLNLSIEGLRSCLSYEKNMATINQSHTP